MLDFKGLTVQYETGSENGLSDLDRPDLSAKAVSKGRLRRLLQIGEREDEKAA